ncbi:LPXTG cell wall anchor domain-containing protein [Streptomyces sp. H27-C3]|uniref:LPXTG cell wall anchor domain-containing protein n=1 Tax=Streptomyces sp. H27-C3 TaxID=3046305 RepID=UPI0024BA816B|nr:LPXTG cell wall anchor domain-containing protein [Streptomyces sp. H27-C3]MDJ0460462.1 LPXTG cell wall anchor domain-containing protein [Streptomyces sp. H27-C3]
MRFRRILATAAVAAVTTPLALLSVTPAFADAKPATQEQSSKPTIKQLEKAAEIAQKAYADAVQVKQDAVDALEALDTDASPLYVARQTAIKEATEAAAAKTAADTAVTEAKTALDALPADATEEQKAAATKAVTDAEAVAKTAAETKTAADTKSETARKALEDARVAAFKTLHAASENVKSTLGVKKAADKALADALEEEGDEGEGECVLEPDFTTVVTGLPGTVVAGKWVDFKLRLTNGTDKTMDEVYPFVSVHATDEKGVKDLSHLLKLQWSSATSKAWQNVDVENYLDRIAPLKAGAHSDVKLRLKVDAKAPAGQGVAFVAGDYWNEDETCGGTPDLTTYEFQIAAAGAKPGTVPPAKPGKATKPPVAAPSPQGTSSPQPVSGALAKTGTNSAVPQIALAGAAAVAVGAGAVFVVRRRKADSAA